MWFPALAAGLALLALSTVNAQDIPITGNDSAPALKVSEWIKGEPVKLEEGKDKKVHVVEFWATWCPPCRESIPHLTELQKKYKDSVTIIGITDEEAPLVKEFVKKMGDKMDYRVALDKNQETAKAFDKIAEMPGIPTAYVINKENKVVWAGHPLDEEFEKVLATLTKDSAKTPESGGA
jgi:thiol-disulfide isomerase/thioredoxin